MTCFWDGLLANLKPKDFARIGVKKKPRKAQDFAAILKERNTKTTSVSWQGERYDCSSFDPFLFLVAELFEVSIIHHGVYGSHSYINDCPSMCWGSPRIVDISGVKDYLFVLRSWTVDCKAVTEPYLATISCSDASGETPAMAKGSMVRFIKEIPR